MTENFDKSEKYRKYVIELQFKEVDLYTIWGTDMLDCENDKLLVKGAKLIVFKTLDLLETSLEKLEHPFMDKQNFKKWVCEENLKQVYNVNNVKLLADFNLNLLEDKKSSLDILNSINLIQDFFIQINAEDLDNIYGDSSVADLKDFIYNNYFWEKRSDGSDYKVLEHTDIQRLLNELYNDFYSKLKIIDI